MNTSTIILSTFVVILLIGLSVTLFFLLDPMYKCNKKGSTPHYDYSSKKCVECLKNGDCGAGMICSDDGSCVMTQKTIGNPVEPNCPPNVQIYDKNTNKCVQCLKNSDCDTGMTCSDDKSCIEVPTPIGNPVHPDCNPSVPIYDKNTNKCVQCMTDSDCASEQHCSSSNTCVVYQTKTTSTLCGDLTVPITNCSGVDCVCPGQICKKPNGDQYLCAPNIKGPPNKYEWRAMDGHFDLISCKQGKDGNLTDIYYCPSKCEKATSVDSNNNIFTCKNKPYTVIGSDNKKYTCKPDPKNNLLCWVN